MAIRFPSWSPFTLADASDPARRAESEEGVGLYWPAARHGAAAVLLHGAAGVSLGREGRLAELLARNGISALVVDSFGAREGGRAGFTDRLLNVTETMLAADAYAARAWLAARPEVDPARIAVIGFSYGGMASLIAAQEQVQRLLARDGGRFAAHVSIYGPCVVRFERVATTGAPALMLLGAEDENVPVPRCRETREDLVRGGSRVELHVYEGAAHQWDSPWARERRRMSLNLSPCAYRVEADGTVRDTFTGIAMEGWLTRRLTLAACVDRSGYWIHRNEAVMERADRDLLRFLDAAFAADETRAGRAPARVAAPPCRGCSRSSRRRSR